MLQGLKFGTEWLAGCQIAPFCRSPPPNLPLGSPLSHKVNKGSTFALRRPTLDFFLGEQRYGSREARDTYQKGARVIHPSADGYGRPPRPQVDRGEIRPHLCTRRAGTRVRTP